MRRVLLSLLCLAVPLSSCVKPLPDAALTVRPPVTPRDGLPDDAPPRILMMITIILAAGLLASCAMVRPSGSWVELGNAADAGPLSDAIVACVTEAAPQRGAIIALASLPEAQAGNPVTGQIRDKLTQRGYRFAGPEAAGQHHLQYQVTRYGQEVLLRVTLDGVEASVLFARVAHGVPKAAAPLAMRQKGKVLQ
jgi:hypothetical protein